MQGIGPSLVAFAVPTILGYLFLRWISRNTHTPDSLLWVLSFSFWSTWGGAYSFAVGIFGVPPDSQPHWGQAILGVGWLAAFGVVAWRGGQYTDRPREARWCWVFMRGLRGFIEPIFAYWGKVIFNDFQSYPNTNIFQRLIRAGIDDKTMANTLIGAESYRSVQRWRRWFRQIDDPEFRNFLARDGWAEDVDEVFRQLAEQDCLSGQGGMGDCEPTIEALEAMGPEGWSKLSDGILQKLLQNPDLVPEQREAVIRATGFRT